MAVRRRNLVVVRSPKSQEEDMWDGASRHLYGFIGGRP